jgi:hypothetical protein
MPSASKSKGTSANGTGTTAPAMPAALSATALPMSSAATPDAPAPLQPFNATVKSAAMLILYKSILVFISAPISSNALVLLG